MARDILDTHQKAFDINLDRNKYGTIAEIGAGQEVARWFFQVGGAAGTVAKSISAYDMAVSDAIYGSATRYVSRERCRTMLEWEFGLLQERLADVRGDDVQFFAFANTVTARSYSRRDAETHGWLGVRFQHQPRAEASEIIIHVRMLDAENLQQQEALGIVGVNLVYAAFHLYQDTGELMSSLLDGLSAGRIEINLVRCAGPAFGELDHRLLALELVKRRLTEATMFRADGEAVDAGELLYRKPLLLLRGSFRPVTTTVVEAVKAARARLLEEVDIDEDNLVVMAEMTLTSLHVDEELDREDFLHRVDLLRDLGIDVLITDTFRYFRLASYLFQHTKQKIGVVMGLPTLEELFDDRFYGDLEGGILEAFGRLFKNDLRIYVSPILDPDTGELVAAENMQVAPNLRHLQAYLIENHFIESLEPLDKERMSVFPRDVLRMLQEGDAAWEDHVPAEVARMIKERGLFRYRA